MAEVHSVPATTAGTLPAHGSILIALQHDIGSIKQELKDLKTMVGSFIEEMKDLKQVKVETVGDIFIFVSSLIGPRTRHLHLLLPYTTRITVDPPPQSSLLSPIIGSILRCIRWRGM